MLERYRHCEYCGKDHRDWKGYVFKMHGFEHYLMLGGGMAIISFFLMMLFRWLFEFFTTVRGADGAFFACAFLFGLWAAGFIYDADRCKLIRINDIQKRRRVKRKVK